MVKIVDTASRYKVARNHMLNTLKQASRKAEVVGEIVRHAEMVRNPVEDKVLAQEYYASENIFQSLLLPRLKTLS